MPFSGALPLGRRGSSTRGRRGGTRSRSSGTSSRRGGALGTFHGSAFGSTRIGGGGNRRLFDVGGRRRNRRDGEVALDDRLHAFGQREVMDVKAVADLHPFEIAVDVVGDVVGRAIDLDLVPDDVDHAAELQARRIFLAVKANGDGDTHARAGLEPHEIDMDRPVGDGIELDGARQDAHLLAADVQVDQRLEHGAGVIQLAENALVDLHGLGLALPAIDDAGNLALAAHLIGRAFAQLGARFGGEVDHFTHGGNP